MASQDPLPIKNPKLKIPMSESPADVIGKRKRKESDIEDNVEGYVQTSSGKKKIFRETVAQQNAGQGKNPQRYIWDEEKQKKVYVND